jgi:hypothetical protein
VDERIHRYELDIEALWSELQALLAARGYHTVDSGDTDTWIFETHWGRGAAYGEIGSTLYGLVSARLRELDQ